MFQISDQTWFLVTEERKKNEQDSQLQHNYNDYYYFLPFFFFFLNKGADNFFFKARSLQFEIMTQLKPRLPTTSSALGAHGSPTVAAAFNRHGCRRREGAPPTASTWAEETNEIREEQREDDGSAMRH